MDAGSRAEAPGGRLGDRLERAIEHHADLPAELERGEQELDAAPESWIRRMRRKLFWLAVSGVSLYLVAPSVIDALGSWRQIQRLSLAWLAAMAVLQAGGARVHVDPPVGGAARRALAAGHRLAARG